MCGSKKQTRSYADSPSTNVCGTGGGRGQGWKEVGLVTWCPLVRQRGEPGHGMPGQVVVRSKGSLFKRFCPFDPWLASFPSPPSLVFWFMRWMICLFCSLLSQPGSLDIGTDLLWGRLCLHAPPFGAPRWSLSTAPSWLHHRVASRPCRG